MKSKNIIFFITIFTVLCLSACRTNGPWSINEAVWYSENPEIKIIKKIDTDWLGYIIVGGEKKDIELLWGPSRSFEIVNRGYEMISEEITLLRGTFDFNDESATLKIEKDNAFNGKYKDKTIVLYRKSIDENNRLFNGIDAFNDGSGFIVGYIVWAK